MKLRSLTEIKGLIGRKVLLRTDYNVQITGNKILDIERIKRTFQTIDYLRSKGAQVIIISHLGRPDGKKDKKYSLAPVARELKKKYAKLQFISDCRGPIVSAALSKMKNGDVALLENVRFYSGEEKNDKKFAAELATLADLYINDAFGVSHRAHASVAAITKLLPSYAGFNLIAEVKNISAVMTGFKKPALAIIGGVKISTKIEVIEKFLKRFTWVAIGGALANNFFMNEGLPIGKSIFEPDYLKVARTLIKKFGSRIILPIDVVISYDLKKAKGVQTIMINELQFQKKGFYIVDIGPQTIELYEQLMCGSKTIVWNGPMGIFEVPKFVEGTYAIARFFAGIANGRPFGLAGGGETVAAINKLKLHNQVDFVSTGGGAMLEFIEKGTLPGLVPLQK